MITSKEIQRGKGLTVGIVGRKEKRRQNGKMKKVLIESFANGKRKERGLWTIVFSLIFEDNIFVEM